MRCPAAPVPAVRAVLALLACLAAAACQSAKVVQQAPFDSADRTITVPAGDRYLLDPLKDELRRHGFVVVEAGREVWLRDRDETALEAMMESKTRYRMYLRQRWTDLCLTGGRRMDFDLSIFDLAIGQEALRIAGRDCSPRVIEKFSAALAAKTQPLRRQ